MRTYTVEWEISVDKTGMDDPTTASGLWAGLNVTVF